MVGAHPALRPLLVAFASSILLAACAGTDPGDLFGRGPTAAAPKVRADDIVGNWGLASYHREQDRARTEVEARNQCRQPYHIGRGRSGGVVMHLADSPQVGELQLKGSPDGKTFIGPAGEIGRADREIASFDGNVMVMRWLDQDVAQRYGTMIYVRCGARA
jgi:hypothetical protein